MSDLIKYRNEKYSNDPLYRETTRLNSMYVTENKNLIENILKDEKKMKECVIMLFIAQGLIENNMKDEFIDVYYDIARCSLPDLYKYFCGEKEVKNNVVNIGDYR